MKIFFLTLTMLLFAGTSAAQIPCLVDVQRYRPYNPMAEAPLSPVWESPKNLPTVYKINAGTSWQLPIVMPVGGICSGGFESRDDRADLAVAATDALGNYIGAPIKPPGDIEILILDEFNFLERQRSRSYTAYYSSGRQFSGNFNVPLRPGYYRLIISNSHSFLAGKQVTFTLGQEFQNQ